MQIRRWTFALIPLFISLLLFPSFAIQTPIIVRSYGTIRSHMVGLNYLSKYHRYSSQYTTDDLLRRDFQLFKTSNISVIAIALYWNHLEGDIRGSYDGINQGTGSPYGDRFLDEVKRVCRIASEFGLKVLLNFHTAWGENQSEWCTPDYVTDPVTGKNIGLAIVRSEDMKQAFLDMATHVIHYMVDDTPFYSWGILNEPWYWPRSLPAPYDSIDQKANFIDMMQKMRNIVKTFDAKRKTHIKFGSSSIWIDSDGQWKIKNSFEESWNWDERILQTIDFAGFDTYLGLSGQPHTEVPLDDPIIGQWKNITAENVLWFSQHGKEVWITEIGSKNDEDEIQRARVKFAIDHFKTLPIKAILGWNWQSDEANPTAEFGLPGKSFNFCKDMYGNPRPAYYELAAFTS